MSGGSFFFLVGAVSLDTPFLLVSVFSFPWRYPFKIPVDPLSALCWDLLHWWSREELCEMLHLLFIVGRLNARVDIQIHVILDTHSRGGRYLPREVLRLAVQRARSVLDIKSILNHNFHPSCKPVVYFFLKCRSQCLVICYDSKTFRG